MATPKGPLTPSCDENNPWVGTSGEFRVGGVEIVGDLFFSCVNLRVVFGMFLFHFGDVLFGTNKCVGNEGMKPFTW